MGKQTGEKLKRKLHEKQLGKLQGEFCRLHDWAKTMGERIVVVLEGHDTACKGGLVNAMTARVSPGGLRVVALPAPSDRDKTQTCIQWYVHHFSTGGVESERYAERLTVACDAA